MLRVRPKFNRLYEGTLTIMQIKSKIFFSNFMNLE